MRGEVAAGHVPVLEVELTRLSLRKLHVPMFEGAAAPLGYSWVWLDASDYI